MKIPDSLESTNVPRRWFVIALITGLVLRVGMLLFVQTYKGEPGAYEHGFIAAALVHGQGFVYDWNHLLSDHPIPTSEQAPAVPLILALCFRIAGVGTPEAYLLMELFNAALALVGIWAIGRIGTTLWNERVGLVAALGFAIYPPLVYAVTRVESLNWSAIFLPLSIYCVLRLSAVPTIRMAVGTGACLGMGALGEPVLLAPALVALGQLLLRNVRLALVVGAAMAITLLPWTLRNVAVHGRLVLIKSTFWYILWEGKYVQSTGSAGAGFSPELAHALSWRLSAEADMNRARLTSNLIDEQAIPAEALAQIRSRPREIDKMDWFREESIRTVREHPGHYLWMCAYRAFKLAWFDSTNPRSLALQYRLSYLSLLFLAVVGVVANLHHPPRQWLVPVTMTLAVALVHVLVIMSARFRIPLEGMMLLPAAYGAIWLTSWKATEAHGVEPAPLESVSLG